MIGTLPKQIELNGKFYNIRSDYRDCLKILVALQDENLTEYDKVQVILRVMYVDEIPQELQQQAIEKAVDFLNYGKSISKPKNDKVLYDWEQDEQIIFSAINKVAGKEIRLVEYLHFWTFVGYFNEIQEGTFSTIVSIRNKKNQHKKLEKWEQEYYFKNKEMIDIKQKYSEEDKSDLAEIEKLLKGV